MCADAEVSSSCFAAERVVEDRLDSATNVLAASQQQRWRLLDDSLWTLRQHSEKPDPALAVLRTLFDQPRWVDPSYLYDDRGSDLFEEISQLPEYYLTRLEDGILEQEAANIVAAAPGGDRDFLPHCPHGEQFPESAAYILLKRNDLCQNGELRSLVRCGRDTRRLGWG